MTVHSGSNAGTYFYAYDGNGNVIALIDASDGTIAAQCEYGPFGEVIRATGDLAEENPFRFSTKYQDDETDLPYYGHRFYSPNLGRWPNRDPIGELGGLNLYEYVGNDVSHQLLRSSATSTIGTRTSAWSKRLFGSFQSVFL